MGIADEIKNVFCILPRTTRVTIKENSQETAREITTEDGEDTEERRQMARARVGDELKEIIRHHTKGGPFDEPLQSLRVWWMVDLVTLSNILWLLILGGLAALALRSPNLSKGLALPGYMRVALPLGIISGNLLAPVLLTDVSPYFQHIASGDRDHMLWIGLAPFLLLMALPARTSDDRLLRRLSVFACSLPVGALIIGFYFWQMRGLGGIADLRTICYNLSSEGGLSGPDLSLALLWCTPVVSLLIFSVTAIISRACRVPLAVGLARGFRGLVVPVAAILFLVYGGMLLFTMRSEAAVQYGLERMVDNEGQYVAELSGKQWVRPAPTPKPLQKQTDTK